VVTHLTTNPPVSCLNRAERTGSLVLKILWSYVKDLAIFGVYIPIPYSGVILEPSEGFACTPASSLLSTVIERLRFCVLVQSAWTRGLWEFRSIAACHSNSWIRWFSIFFFDMVEDHGSHSFPCILEELRRRRRRRRSLKVMTVTRSSSSLHCPTAMYGLSLPFMFLMTSFRLHWPRKLEWLGSI
jgi:hypothetical protein